MKEPLGLMSVSSSAARVFRNIKPASCPVLQLSRNKHTGSYNNNSSSSSPNSHISNPLRHSDWPRGPCHNSRSFLPAHFHRLNSTSSSGSGARHQKINKSSATGTLIFLLTATALSAGIYYTSTQASHSISTSIGAISDKMSTNPSIAMPAKLDGASLHAALQQRAATGPAGREGNLTPEQTLKLKEFWGRLLELFGQYKPKAGTATAAPVVEQVPEKKSGGFFGRKAAPAPAEVDKFGQNEMFDKAVKEMTPQELETTFYNLAKQDTPDAVVLRYLRARKWDVQAALVMLVSTLHWRAREMKIDDLMASGEAGALKDAGDATDPARKKEGEDFISQFRMGKCFVHGYDKEGRPNNYVRVKLHKGGEQTVSSIEKFTVFLIETTRLMIFPPQDTGTIVFDMTGFSLANMDYTPVKFMIKCFEANYPESLGAVVIYKSPWIFQGIWKIIKGWLDPVVAAKVHFANNINEMSEYIAPTQVTKECDGQDTYEYQYIEPVAGENAAMADTATRDKYLQERSQIAQKVHQNTIQWIEGANVEAERQRLFLDLHLNYFKLDPYIRARSLYDRLGLIKSHNQFGWDKSAVEAAL